MIRILRERWRVRRVACPACRRGSRRPRLPRSATEPAMSNSLYDRDFYAWAQHQAALLRAGRAADIDSEHLAEEIESLGARERRELRNRVARLVQHLLKWRYQP